LPGRSEAETGSVKRESGMKLTYERAIEVLELQEEAGKGAELSEETIKRAFKRLALKQ
jgi:hypothetical protein